MMLPSMSGFMKVTLMSSESYELVWVCCVIILSNSLLLAQRFDLGRTALYEHRRRWNMLPAGVLPHTLLGYLRTLAAATLGEAPRE